MKVTREVIVIENVERAKRNRKSYSVSIKKNGVSHFYESVTPKVMRQLVASNKGNIEWVYDHETGEFLDIA